MSLETTSQAQIDANRLNAQQCTGPRTEAGKARSSRNATKHGLFASSVIVTPEEEALFNALAEDLRNEHYPGSDLPTGPTELFHHNQVLLALWNLTRLDRMEAAIFDETGEDPFDPKTPETRARYEHLAKCRARLERTYQRFLRIFLQYRKDYEKHMAEATKEYWNSLPQPQAEEPPSIREEREMTERNQSPASLEHTRIQSWLRNSTYLGGFNSRVLPDLTECDTFSPVSNPALTPDLDNLPGVLT